MTMQGAPTLIRSIVRTDRRKRILKNFPMAQAVVWGRRRVAEHAGNPTDPGRFMLSMALCDGTKIAAGPEPRQVMGWFPMLKGVGNFRRYAEVCMAANHRYLAGFAAVDNPAKAQ